MKTFFTSDLHLGHKRIIELSHRPFSSVDEMNEKIIENWNNVVRSVDRVYVLGDVVMGTIAETLPLIKRLNGTKFLVPGNHDRVWPYYHSERDRERQLNKWRTEYSNVGFVLLDTYVTYLTRYGKERFGLSHFPYEGDSTYDERYAEYRPKRKDAMVKWLVHGHVHEAWAINGNQINVGVDVRNFTPVSEDELIEMMK